LLQLHSISLVQFKNYVGQGFQFTRRIVGICGPNGVGKTNLLDAIYYLCFTKSYFGRSDAQNAHAGLAGFRIEGSFELNDKMRSALCIVRDTGRKEFSLDGDAYEKFALHVGRFPCVIIAPDDIDNRIRDINLLDVYDEQLVPDGNYIFNKRNEFLDECLVLVKDLYKQISGNNEAVNIIYESQLHRAPFDKILKSMREKDMLLQRTNGGIHKDDLQIFLNNQVFKNIASQGQRKSLLFALKLAEFEMLRINKKFPPLLLLDDVFEKLDEQRMHNLLDKVCVQNNGQIFITDTHRSRIEEHFGRLGINYQLIDL
jgi:DNA replication and repair protein RecF